MPTPGSTRSVKIGSEERGGWSSERPRKEGAPPRPVDVSVRCSVLSPAARLRYSPGSLLVVASASPAEATRLLERVLEEQGALLSTEKVRRLLAGRVAEAEMQDRVRGVLAGAIQKRLQANQAVVVVTEGLGPDERAALVRLAHASRRPRHLILLETSLAQVAEDQRRALNELRRALGAGELGAEGFQTALRLGGSAPSELKRIVFHPPPSMD